MDILKSMKLERYSLLYLFGLLIFLSVLSAGGSDEPWQWHDLSEAYDSAMSEGKHLIINFYAPGCFWCKKMDKMTFADTSVSRMLAEGFVGAKVNIASNRKLEWQGSEMTERELAQAFAVRGTPNTAFLDSTGNVIARLPGYVNAERFKIVLRFIGGDWYNELSFQEYLMSESALHGGTGE